MDQAAKLQGIRVRNEVFIIMNSSGLGRNMSRQSISGVKSGGWVFLSLVLFLVAASMTLVSSYSAAAEETEEAAVEKPA